MAVCNHVLVGWWGNGVLGVGSLACCRPPRVHSWVKEIRGLVARACLMYARVRCPFLANREFLRENIDILNTGVYIQDANKWGGE